MGLALAPPCKVAGCSPLTPGDGGSPLEAVSPELAQGAAEGGWAFQSLPDLVAAWPELAELRRAASSPNVNRLRCALTALVCNTRVQFVAALLEAGPTALASCPVGRPAQELGQARHQAAQGLLRQGASIFSNWFMSKKHAAHVLEQVEQLVSLGPGLRPCEPPSLPSCVEAHHRFPLTVPCFLAALAEGWQWGTALDAFARIDKGQFFDDFREFTVSGAGSSADSKEWFSSTLYFAGEGSALTIFVASGCIQLVRGTFRLQPQSRAGARPAKLLTSGRPTRFLPDYIRLACDASSGLFELPPTRVTAVVERKGVWLDRLGPLDGTARAVVNGHFFYPRKHWAFAPSFKRNHPSWEKDPEAKRALGSTIAAWLYSGVLEYVPPECNPPLVVEPVGAVPKNSPPGYRLITDARISNKDLDEWPVRYWSVVEAAAGLRYGALMCADDAKDAYHLSAFAGCSGKLIPDDGWVLQPDGALSASRLHYLGCSPRTCLGTCDKARSGICLDGFLFRFAAAQFGQKLAGSPLNALFLPIIRHLFRRFGPSGLLLGILCFLWVDDLFMAQNIAAHGRCGGLSLGCPVCISAAGRFALAQSYWHSLAVDLGITLSLSKRQQISQRAEYTGIVLDTISGRFFIPEKKLVKLRASLTDFGESEAFTLRSLASVRGRILHYSLCIMYIRPLVPLLSAPADFDLQDLDASHPMSVALQRACTLLLGLVDRFSAAGAPMWPSVPSSLYGRLLRGELTGVRVFAIVWDSSKLGWGAVLRWQHNLQGELIVCTWDPGEAEDAQVQREAKGGVRALAAALKIADLRNSVGIFRNDSVGSLSALRKGCSSSPALQECATTFNQLCADFCVEPLFLHAPGSVLVEEGIDSASRDLASKIAGPACSPSLKRKVFSLAARHGWSITVDAFASFGNRVVDRYFSEYAEPESEAVDAFAVTDWHASLCPGCGLWHRETLHVFAPSTVMRRFMAKAAEDGARAIVVTPFSITSSFWRGLLEAAMPVNDRGDLYELLRNLEDLLIEPENYRGSHLALLAVDFSRLDGWARRSVVEQIAPGCGEERRFRGRPLEGHAQDVEDRSRIMQQLGQTQASPLKRVAI